MRILYISSACSHTTEAEVVATELLWTEKLKIVIFLPLKEKKIGQPLS